MLDQPLLRNLRPVSLEVGVPAYADAAYATENFRCNPHDQQANTHADEEAGGFYDS